MAKLRGVYTMPESYFRLLVLVALVVLGGAVYLNTCDGQWVWDDVSSVLLHQSVQAPGLLLHGEGGTSESPWLSRLAAAILELFREDQHAFGRGQGNFYRPLVSLSFAADFALSHRAGQTVSGAHPQLSPLFFHLGNILWHLIAAGLFFALLTHWGAPRFVRASVPLLYVVHPLHTEAVAYISGRADMMSAVFLFAALYFATGEKIGLRRYGAWMLMLFAIAAGLCSKESSAIFPLLLLAVFLVRNTSKSENSLDGKVDAASLPHQRGRKPLLLSLCPLVLSTLAVGLYFALRSTILNFAPGKAAVASTPFSQRLTETLQAFAFYLRDLFFPVHLHMEQTLADTPGWTALVGAVLLLGIVALLIHAVQRGWKNVATGLAWFLVTWLPISGLFPLNAPMAEHWMYVPMAGFWWAAAELLWLGVGALQPARPWAAPAAACAVFLLLLEFCGLTAARNDEWDNNERLFLSTLRENPNSFRVQYNLAVTYEDILKNPPAARRHYDEARRLILRAGSSDAALAASRADVELSLARIHLEQGNYTEAAEHFSAVLSGRPNPEFGAEAIFGMGKSLLALGELGNAYAHLEQAAQINPALAPEAQRLIEGGAIE